MVVQRQAVHVWLHSILTIASFGACVEEDPDKVGTVDGAVQPGPGFDAGAVAGGGTTGGFSGVGTTGGGMTGGTVGSGTTGGFPGATTGGGTTGGFFGGGFLGGRPDGAVTDAGAAVDSGVPVSGDAGPDPYAELRQLCVDTINMYRATEGLLPLTRASTALETCSDQGAQYDGEMNRGRPQDQIEGHLSTKVPGKGWMGMEPGRLCGSPDLGPQNTCPGWPGRPSLADSLRRCLAQMWAESEPPEGVAACKAAYFAGDTRCFLAHGHWINMAEPTANAVSCGFFDMGNNAFWMNQDFIGSMR